MTDKEQIIKNGVNVSECIDYDNGCCKGSCCLNSVSIVNSCDPQNMRCDFYVNKLEDQLARKTQECEKLKDKFKKFFGIDNQECWDIAFLKDENARYRKALEEIEEVCMEDTRTFADGTQLRYSSLDEILYIINKAKGERNAV